MRQRRRNILFMVILLFCITACTKELDLDHLRPESRLVLNSIVVSGEPVAANLSHTWFFTDNHPNVTLTGADVQLYVNGQWKEKMSWEVGDSAYNNIGQYVSTYKPQVGEEVKISAHFNETEVTATTILPEICPIIKATIDSVFIPGYSEKRLQISVTFQDNPDMYNYYLVHFEWGTPILNPETMEYTEVYKWEPLIMGYDNDPLFTGDVEVLEVLMGGNWLNGYHGRVFSNDLFRGGEYTFNVYEVIKKSSWSTSRSENPENPPFCYRVYLYTISESYYKYMKSVIGLYENDIHNDFVNAGLAEPIYIHSNVTGGTGIVGGCSPDMVTLPLPNSSP